METMIYYLSGRGNSLYTALSLAKKLKHAQAVSMTNALDFKNHADCIGIVTPVIDLGIPAYVRKFMRRFKDLPGQPYIFAVVTCGGMPAGSMRQLEKLAAKQKTKLSAGFVLKFGLEPWIPEAWDQKMDEIVGCIENRRECIETAAIKDRLLTGLGNTLARRIIPTEDKKFKISENCTGCGICEKLCPAGNIQIINGKPVFSHHCEQCAACFGWCPQEAVTGTNLAARTRYTNQNITLQDMMHPEGVSV